MKMFLRVIRKMGWDISRFSLAILVLSFIGAFIFGPTITFAKTGDWEWLLFYPTYVLIAWIFRRIELELRDDCC